ncbi:MAG: fibrobacter succinogenes major paralogous domain-containing protein [Alphaproteobacteria bacterium]|nr:fibrobacter succinogenes major paralogous domain-containing protein [Alphaproteobacteria bacterium]
MTFNQAAKYAKSLKVGGKKGFHVPSEAELKVLFDNRKKGALKGTFNLTGANRSGWYWSSAPGSQHTPTGKKLTRADDDFGASVQRFSDGLQFSVGKDETFSLSVRCVRC